MKKASTKNQVWPSLFNLEQINTQILGNGALMTFIIQLDVYWF
jgi:hypothetical protein